MSFNTAKACIDDIFSTIPEGTKLIEISFIGGEPLLEMSLIKDIFNYVNHYHNDDRVVFFATTNGTTLSGKDKRWFEKHKERFVLGLSLDGTPQTHNANRSDSFDHIDIPFFVSTWPKQGPKMTISKQSLSSFADDIIYIHNQGFESINGVNFAEGDFNWDNNEDLRVFSKQLHKLMDYYTENPSTPLDQLFGKHIEFCACDHDDKHKTCGIGTRTAFYDVDGRKYPCSFTTPLTFNPEELSKILHTNFEDSAIFVDDDCKNNCYIFPVCGTCPGSNYLVHKSFSQRNKSRCKMNKIACLFIAELHARRILNHRELYKDENQLYFLIEAIKGIRNNYYDDFSQYLTML